MELIKVNKDENSKSDDLSFEYTELPTGHTIKKIVYWYEVGDYDGSGWALVQKADGWLSVCLGHCSCYGPEENIREAYVEQGQKIKDLKF